ncbi:MAG TPA: hypothetical protein VIC52_06115 [Actinomycetota bacterium]|jgi:Fe-S cluster assembly iron-binding protein IscA
MLLVTDHAATLFREILARDEITGDAIRLVARATDDGSTRIVLTTIDGPTEADVPTQADGVDVYVAPELAPQVDGAVLDAEKSEAGDRFVLRPPDGA